MYILSRLGYLVSIHLHRYLVFWWIHLFSVAQLCKPWRDRRGINWMRKTILCNTSGKNIKKNKRTGAVLFLWDPRACKHICTQSSHLIFQTPKTNFHWVSKIPRSLLISLGLFCAKIYCVHHSIFLSFQIQDTLGTLFNDNDKLYFAYLNEHF